MFQGQGKPNRPYRALCLYMFKVDLAQLIGKLTEGKAKGVTRILTNRYSDWG